MKTEKPNKKRRHPIKAIKKCVKNLKIEATRISWPTFKETFKKFVTVCLFVIVMTLLFTGMDSIISLMIKLLGGVN